MNFLRKGEDGGWEELPRLWEAGDDTGGVEPAECGGHLRHHQRLREEADGPLRVRPVAEDLRTRGGGADGTVPDIMK